MGHGDRSGFASLMVHWYLLPIHYSCESLGSKMDSSRLLVLPGRFCGGVAVGGGGFDKETLLFSQWKRKD